MARVGGPERLVQAVLLVLSTLLASFFFSVNYELSSHGGRTVGAAYGWTGEKGSLTVTGEARGGGRTSGRKCVGTFAPARGGPIRPGVDVHVSGRGCEIGRTEKARFVPGYDSWLRTERDGAYDESGAGAGGLLVALVLVNLFCGVLGLVCAVFALGIVRELVRRPSS
ncbi:hypothetical protein ACFHW2_23480 [Actinomadura sp. LOL_016]|uniref:hypothetical protein n=1 Tax=unclassified Actinomadura TaxID=2626254 RepID=UPI003A802C7D